MFQLKIKRFLFTILITFSTSHTFAAIGDSAFYTGVKRLNGRYEPLKMSMVIIQETPRETTIEMVMTVLGYGTVSKIFQSGPLTCKSFREDQSMCTGPVQPIKVPAGVFEACPIAPDANTIAWMGNVPVAALIKATQPDFTYELERYSGEIPCLDPSVLKDFLY